MERPIFVYGDEFDACVYAPGASPSFPDSYMVEVIEEDGRIWMRKFFDCRDDAVAFARREVA